jgi:hypothetical protein
VPHRNLKAEGSHIWPPPWFSGILIIRKSEDSIMLTPPRYFESRITGRIRKRKFPENGTKPKTGKRQEAEKKLIAGLR